MDNIGSAFAPWAFLGALGVLMIVLFIIGQLLDI